MRCNINVRSDQTQENDLKTQVILNILLDPDITMPYTVHNVRFCHKLYGSL